MLRQLAKEGRTVIVVTHDATIAKQADVRIELEDGQIVNISTREERALLAKPPAPAPKAPRATRRGRR